MRFLVTGGAGFIGSHLVDALVGAGHSVRVLDDLSTGRRANLSQAVSLSVGTIADTALLARLAEGVDGIFHLAARSSVQGCIADWLPGHQDNLIGTINVLSAAVGAGCPVVYASSAAVYGDRSDRICDEAARETPISPYGADKLACEHQASAFAAIHGLPSVGLRFFNVYGARQNLASPYAGVIARFIDDARAGRGHVVYGDGLQSRDFVAISDAIAGLCAAMRLARTGPARAEVVNICTGQATTLLDLIGAISGALGNTRPPEITHLPARPGDIRHSVGATARMQALLGLRAQVGLDQGLAHLLALPGG